MNTGVDVDGSGEARGLFLMSSVLLADFLSITFPKLITEVLLDPRGKCSFRFGSARSQTRVYPLIYLFVLRSCTPPWTGVVVNKSYNSIYTLLRTLQTGC